MNHKEEQLCWYHGKLSREDAETMLLADGRPDGLFLVRESNSSNGDFVLSVLFNGQVSHYQIRRHTEDVFFSIDNCLRFHGLEILIEHYYKPPGLLSGGLILTDFIRGDSPPHDCRRHGRTNLLHRATSQGDYTVVSALLKTGYRHEAKNQDGQTAVHLASINGKNEILKKLIDYEASVNIRDTAGYSPLHYAAQYNLPTTVRLLVQTGGANIQVRHTETGSVPLHIAARYGHKETVNELLSLNAPVNPRNNADEIPAQVAREHGHIECAEILEKYQSPAPKTSRLKWYHGTLGRQEAENIIRSASMQSGTFLVRFSERNKEKVLTLVHENVFFNYLIQTKNGYLFIDNGPYLETLEHIVEYYSFIPDGLPTILKTPVLPKPKPPVPAFSTIPRRQKKVTATKPKSPEKLEVQPTESYNTTDPSAIPSQFHNISFTSTFTLTNNNNEAPQNQDDYIEREQLRIGAVIGEGEFASVFEGTYTKPNGDTMKVAIKQLRNEQMETNQGAFLSEAQVMIKLNHHCIVKLIGLCLGEQLLMIQELVPLGSLLQYIIKHRDNVNPECEFKIWAAQIACGMKYLEEQRFVHRDLAARNILLACRVQAKISDFGLSRALGTGHEYYRALRGGKWPLKWYAPESYNYGHFSHKSDVWSFGVTIWEMYSFGKAPYGDIKGSEAIKLIDEGQRLEQPEKCPPHIYDIMTRCWDTDADKRPSFSELLDVFTLDTEYTNLRELLPDTNLA